MDFIYIYIFILYVSAKVPHLLSTLYESITEIDLLVFLDEYYDFLESV